MKKTNKKKNKILYYCPLNTLHYYVEDGVVYWMVNSKIISKSSMSLKSFKNLIKTGELTRIKD